MLLQGPEARGRGSRVELVLVQAWKAEKVNPRVFSQVTGMHSLDAQTCGGRGMGPTTRLQNHVREVTWVWHYGARKSLGE